MTTSGRYVFRVEHGATRVGPYCLCGEDGHCLLSGLEGPAPQQDGMIRRHLPEGVDFWDLGLQSVCLSAGDLERWFRNVSDADALEGKGVVARAYWIPERKDILIGRGQALVPPHLIAGEPAAEVSFETLLAGGAWALASLLPEAPPAPFTSPAIPVRQR